MSHRPARRTRRHQPHALVATITRTQAVDRLTTHLARRDAHLLAIPPELLADAARRLAPLTRTHYYLDSGEGEVLALSGAPAPAILATAVQGGAAAAVTVAAIPNSDLHRLAGLGITLPDRLPHPFSVLDSAGTLLWPMFLLDALQRTDPALRRRIVGTALIPPGNAP